MKVGKIKNIVYDEKEDKLEIVIKITDDKFKKKILRDLNLAGKIKFEEDKLIFIEEEDADI